MLKGLVDRYKNTTLVFRILMGIAIIVFVLTGIQIIILNSSASSEEKQIIESALKNKDALIKKADILADTNMELAILFANMEKVKKAIEDRDRQLLYATVKPIIDSINKGRDVKIKVHFHLPPGISFLRVWKPNKNGDDISSFRKTVVDVLTNGKTVKGIEAGRVGLAIRGIAPIFRDGEKTPMASVEVATSLSAVAKEMESSINGKIQLFALQRVKTTAASSKLKYLGKYAILTKNPLDKMEVDEAFLDKAITDGQAIKNLGNLLIAAVKIPDYNNSPTGVCVQYIDLSALHGLVQKQMMTSSGIAVVAGFLAIVFTIIGLKMTLQEPLAKTMAVLEKTTHGDLTKYVRPHGALEIRNIGKMANNVIYTTGHLLNLLKKQSLGLKDTTRELTAATEIVKDGSTDIDQAAKEVAESSSEASATLENVANSTQELADATNEIAHNVADTARATNEAKEKAQYTNKVIKELGENSEKIGGIIQVINSIAEQTNLLALNATIEAARAGEAGKGFAVVANEVKELAKQTSEATDEITRMIQVIQKGTTEAVTSVQEITTSVSEVNDFANTIASAAEEQTATVSEINESVSQGANKVKTLEAQAHTLAEQAKDFSHIARTIETVQNITVAFSNQLSDVTDLYSVEYDVLHEVSRYATPKVQLTGSMLGQFAWLESIRLAIMEDKVPEIKYDPDQCFIGKWIERYKDDISVTGADMKKLISLHVELHEYAKELKQMTEKGASRQERLALYMDTIQPKFMEMLHLVRTILNNLEDKKLVEV